MDWILVGLGNTGGWVWIVSGLRIVWIVGIGGIVPGVG